ncbi:hypothetical protein EX30DRAFT_375694 [Ascodesmis nigricans]|uniref:Uncharacterized protein n=1 Tax=Ascodesmis nigricans TaxID=341454 RepID=A0A4S2MHN8_9PEZI|nr:hypothetical protein EX30DRAFT_375694 [Ascodesmis nigricans]
MRSSSSRRNRDSRKDREDREDRRRSRHHHDSYYDNDDNYSYDYERAYDRSDSPPSRSESHHHQHRNNPDPRPPRGYASEYYDSFDPTSIPPSRPKPTRISTTAAASPSTEALVFSVLKRLSARSTSSKGPHKSEGEVLRSVTKVLGGPKGALAVVLAEWIWRNYDVLLPMLQRGMEYVRVMVGVFLGVWKKGEGMEGGKLRGLVEGVRAMRGEKERERERVDGGGRVLGEVEEVEGRRGLRRGVTTRW